MSLRAQRLPAATRVDAFSWAAPAAAPGAPPAPVKHISVPAATTPAPLHTPAPADAAEVSTSNIDHVADADRTATIERDAFVKGYAQGERSGEEAAAGRGEAMLRRLAGTIDEVAALRTDLMRRTERELVNLALVIAERIIAREVTLDRELLVTMARVAIDRLGERASATIRLNPADHAALATARGRDAAIGGPVQIVADPHVSRGGCLVQSDFGLMDLGIEAQVSEMSRALLGTGDANSEDGRHASAVTHG